MVKGALVVCYKFAQVKACSMPRFIPMQFQFLKTFVMVMAAAGLCTSAQAATETKISRIVLMRHAEKPPAGLGQINCRGLRRALALPDVLIGFFGHPNQIIAPNPGHTKPDHGINYAYIRPLATIEPTAIRLGMPVDVEFGYEDIDGLRNQLVRNTQQSTQIWVAWEHRLLVKMERSLLSDLGKPNQAVADWDDLDFDRLDVIEIRKEPNGSTQISYEQRKQNLNNLPDNCPR